MKATCKGCGKEENVVPEKPKPEHWIHVFNPLFGKPWDALCCDWACEFKARYRDIGAHLRRQEM